MKMATLTYHKHDNYGAVLQCFALQQAILKLNVETEIIDYSCNYVLHPWGISVLVKKGIKGYIEGVAGIIIRLPRHNKFNQFRNTHLQLSQPVSRSTLTKIENIYDGYIVGSDNVWNAEITNFDTTYFLDFVTDNRKKMTYAASFGSDEIPASLRPEYKILLSDFSCFNMRELSGVKVITSLLGKNAVMVLDPTMLLTKNDWEKLALIPNISFDYILAYQMKPSKDFCEYVSSIADKTGYKIVFIPFPMGKNIRCNWGLNYGPQEWIGLIMNAKIIITDSFHGCVFSILLEKQFYVIISQLGTRIANLLKTFDLEKRQIAIGEKPDFTQIIDYKHVYNILKVKREDSLAVIQDLINTSQELKNDINQNS